MKSVKRGVVMASGVAVLQAGAVGLMLLSGGCKSSEALENRTFKPAPQTDAPKAAAPAAPTAPVSAAPATQEGYSPAPTAAAPAKDEFPPFVAEPVQSLTYTAKKDDSLWTVAKKYDVSVGELACANNLPTTAKIKEGQKLVIPPGGFLAPAGDAKRYGPAAGKKADTAAHAATAKKADTHAKAEPKKDSPPAAAAPAAPKGQIEYEIKKNDTPATIAAKYKVKVEAILAANKGLDPAKLQIGKKIIIPGATAPAAASPAQTPAHAKTVAATAPKTPAPPSADKAAPKSPAPAQPSKDAAAAADLLKSKPGKSADDIIKGMQQPGAAAAAPSETVETVVSAPASGNAETIDIEEDITVQNLAEQYGVKIDDIVKLNPALKPGATVKAGSKVKLP